MLQPVVDLPSDIVIEAEIKKDTRLKKSILCAAGKVMFSDCKYFQCSLSPDCMMMIHIYHFFFFILV